MAISKSVHIEKMDGSVDSYLKLDDYKAFGDGMAVTAYVGIYKNKEKARSTLNVLDNQLIFNVVPICPCKNFKHGIYLALMELPFFVGGVEI